MNILVLLVLAAVVGVAFFFRKTLQGQPAVVVLLIVMVVGATIGMLRKDRSHPDLSKTPVYERSVGHALGQAAAAAFPDGGRLLVVRLRFDKPWAKIKADGYVDGLEQGLKGSRLKIGGIEPKSVFPGAYIGLDEPTIPFPALMELLTEYPDVVGIVSFCGFPQVPLAELPDEVPPLLVAGTHSLRRGDWLHSGRALAMVVGRRDVADDVDLSEDRPLDEVFAAINYLVTSNNLLETARDMRR